MKEKILVHAKVILLKVFLILIPIFIAFPIAMVCFGAIDHYGSQANDHLISRLSYYDEIRFPFSLFNRDAFVNIYMSINKSKTITYIQESYSNPKCKIEIKELETGKITYWTKLSESKECRK